VLPVASEIKADSFLPSSRSIAVRKAAAESVGGYPEWLDYCEDLIFDLRLKATQPPFEFVPDALVYFRPRSTLRAFYKQYYLYARGDGKANLWRKRHAIRYFAYLVAAPMIVLLSILIHPAFWFFALLGAQIYLYQPYQRLPHIMRHPSKLAWLQVILLIPVIRVVGDIAKMHGYPAGLRWRSQQHPPDWKKI
jgi:hypothetical protein